VSDVVGGLLLGACFAPLFMARLAWHFSGWQQLQQQEASGLQLQLSGLGEPLGRGVPPVSNGEMNGHSAAHLVANMHH
jgi:hypothetical protein